MIPLIIFASMLVGAPFVGDKVDLQDQSFNIDFIKNNLVQYIIGSFILSVTCSLLFGFLSYFVLQKFKPQKDTPE